MGKNIKKNFFFGWSIGGFLASLLQIPLQLLDLTGGKKVH